jgi:hypothetical protein
MSLFGFGKRSRRRSHRSRRSKRVSRRSRRGSFERVGNKVHVVGKKGKTKVLKIKKNAEGREYYVSGKRKTKHFLGGKVRKSRRSRRVSRRKSRKSRRVSRRKSRRSRRRFGYMKNSLLNMMGNFQPPS